MFNKNSAAPWLLLAFAIVGLGVGAWYLALKTARSMGIPVSSPFGGNSIFGSRKAGIDVDDLKNGTVPTDIT